MQHKRDYSLCSDIGYKDSYDDLCRRSASYATITCRSKEDSTRDREMTRSEKRLGQTLEKKTRPEKRLGDRRLGHDIELDQ
jgi:hypothetical protein